MLQIPCLVPLFYQKGGRGTQSYAEKAQRGTERREMMIYVWIMVGILILTVVVVFGVGIMLPKSYQFEDETTLKQSPEAVWQVVSGVGAIVDANFANRTAQRLPDENGLPVWLIDMGRNQMTIQTVESVELERLVRVVVNSGVPVSSTYEYVLTPALSAAEGSVSSGTHLRINAEIYLDDGHWRTPILRIFVGLFGKLGLKGFLNSISSRFVT